RLAPAVRRELRDAGERQKRRLAERQLRENQSLLALINEHTSEMLLLFAAEAGPVYRVASVNRAWLGFASRLGLPASRDDFLGKPMPEVAEILASSPQEKEEIHDRFLQAARSGRSVSFEQQWQRGGETLATEQHLIPVVDEQGASRHLLWAG